MRIGFLSFTSVIVFLHVCFTKHFLANNHGILMNNYVFPCIWAYLLQQFYKKRDFIHEKGSKFKYFVIFTGIMSEFVGAYIGISLKSDQFNFKEPWTPWVFIEVPFYMELINLVFYLMHRMYHSSSFLYKWIHSMHHIDNYHPQSVFATNQLSIIEGFLHGFILSYIPSFLFPRLSLHTYLISHFISMLVSRVGHHGLNVRGCAHITIFNYLTHLFYPCCATIKHHDDHHVQNNFNFGFSSMLMDTIFGTLK